MRALILPKTAVHLAALTPLAILAWQTWTVAQGSNALGADPVAEIEHRLGLWALRFLMLTLAITPLRQLTGWNVLVRFRRMLGLYAFAYASLHFATYLGLEVTSTNGWIKRLGRNWARLHKLVYLVAVLAVLHFWWLVKSDIRDPAIYAAIAAVLLGWRAVKALQRRRKPKGPVRSVPRAPA